MNTQHICRICHTPILSFVGHVRFEFTFKLPFGAFSVYFVLFFRPRSRNGVMFLSWSSSPPLSHPTHLHFSGLSPCSPDVSFFPGKWSSHLIICGLLGQFLFFSFFLTRQLCSLFFDQGIAPPVSLDCFLIPLRRKCWKGLCFHVLTQSQPLPERCVLENMNPGYHRPRSSQTVPAFAEFSVSPKS